MIKRQSHPDSNLSKKTLLESKSALERESENLGTVTEDEASDQKSGFSSRHSYLDQDYKVRVNDSEVGSIHLTKSKNLDSVDSPPVRNHVTPVKEKSHSHKRSEVPEIPIKDDVFFLTQNMAAPTEQKSIKRLNDSDFSIAERLELEKTISQLSNRMDLGTNVVKVEKVKPVMSK